MAILASYEERKSLLDGFQPLKILVSICKGEAKALVLIGGKVK
ncbi:hypothetical protein SAMN05518872_105117 [Psychrobacillus sp. OK032]|nr:hypothetical protein SAMN05518872_105117 [Psychrobacillus sp. OK032]